MSFICLFFHGTDIIMTLLQHFVFFLHFSVLSVIKINVWHNIEQRTMHMCRRRTF